MMNNSEMNMSVDNSNESVDTNKKNSIVLLLAIAIVVVTLILTVILIAAVVKGKNNADNEPTVNYVVTTNNDKPTETTNIDLEAVLGGEDSSKGEADGISDEGGKTQSDNQKPNSNALNATTDRTTSKYNVEYYEQLSPNGENKLSDYYQNKYIKMISSKYGVDSDLLVAIYSEPNTGNNFVLQFSGKTDGDGLVIKSPDTLEKVYHIDKKGEISVATGKKTGNEGVSYAEGAMVFNMIKVIVMEQYPEYFTGLKN